MSNEVEKSPWAIIALGLCVLMPILILVQMAWTLLIGFDPRGAAPVSGLLSQPVTPFLKDGIPITVDNSFNDPYAIVAKSSSCTRPAPNTAAGYQKLWASLPQSQWGGADVSISVPLPDGRIVWLYGDTLSTHGMVHQSAIVQDRGCLHVSHGGAQLEANFDAHTVQWIEGAKWAPDLGEVMIQFRVITITGHCAWCFKDAGWSYWWGFTVDKAGNLNEGSPLGGRLDQPPMPSSPLVVLGPHHYSYAVHTHPEIKLADGRTLVTAAQNWDDGLHPLINYQPIFSEK